MEVCELKKYMLYLSTNLLRNLQNIKYFFIKIKINFSPSFQAIQGDSNCQEPFPLPSEGQPHSG